MKQVRSLRLLALLLALLCLSACGGAAPTPSASIAPEPTPNDTSFEEDGNLRKMTVEVNGSMFTATLEDNTAVDSLLDMLPLTISMSDYAGFEKADPLGTRLPTSNNQTTTSSGDIVLYSGNQIVIFYGSNSWSYTRLGRIDDLSGWAQALGRGDVEVTLSAAE